MKIIDCTVSSAEFLLAEQKINRALGAGRHVVAVGTTTVRTLEYAIGQSENGTVRPGSGEADIFIYPGYEFGPGSGGVLTIPVCRNPPS